MFGNRRRVEEDLARIRAANFPAGTKTDVIEKGPVNADADADGADPELDTKTVLAIILAALSVVLPYLCGAAALLFAFWLIVRLVP